MEFQNHKWPCLAWTRTFYLLVKGQLALTISWDWNDESPLRGNSVSEDLGRRKLGEGESKFLPTGRGELTPLDTMQSLALPTNFNWLLQIFVILNI